MLALFDTPSLERALTLPLDPKLRRLLHERVDHINALDFDIRESSYYLVVDGETALNDVTEELGWSPLDTPLDYFEDHGGWFELVTTAGNEAAVTVLVRDRDDVAPELLALCRAYMN